MAVADRDWYAEWLLGEIHRMIAGKDLAIEVGADFDEAPGDSYYAGTLNEGGDRWGVARATIGDALAARYRELTGHAPPPRPSEEEVRAWIVRTIADPSAPGVWLAEELQARSDDADPRERMMARAVVEGADA